MNIEGSKKRILALVDCFKDFTDDDHSLSMQDILDHLKKSEMVANRKTIYRDIELLRDLGYDVRRVNHHYYVLYDRQWELHELQLLIDLVNSSRFLTDGQAKELNEKIAKLGSAYQRSDLLRHSNANAFIQNKTNIKTNLMFLWDLNEAIQNRIPIRIEYATGSYTQEYSKTISNDICVEPYALSIWNGQYYWLGHPCDRPKHELHVYRLARLRKIELLKNKPQFKITAKLPDEFPGGHLYLGNSITIRLKTTMNMIDKLQDVFGERVSIKQGGEDEVFAMFKAANNRTTINALLSLGSHIELLEPENFRHQFVEELVRISHIYKAETIK